MQIYKHTTILLALIFVGQLCPSFAKANEMGQINTARAVLFDKSLQLIRAGDYDAALSQIDKTLQNPSLTSYEKATLLQMKGQAHYQLNQYQETIQAFEDAISSSGLLKSKTSQLRLTIAQVLISEGEYQRGAEMMEQWGRAGNEFKPIHVHQIMDAYIQGQHYELALPWAERWFQDARPKVRKHYDLLNFLYNNLGQNEKQIETIKAMAERWPDDKTLSDSLASLYARNGQEREAFEVTRKYYLTGLKTHTENEILILVKYHSHYNMPHEAARILDEEIEKGARI